VRDQARCFVSQSIDWRRYTSKIALVVPELGNLPDPFGIDSKDHRPAPSRSKPGRHLVMVLLCERKHDDIVISKGDIRRFENFKICLRHEFSMQAYIIINNPNFL